MVPPRRLIRRAGNDLAEEPTEECAWSPHGKPSILAPGTDIMAPSVRGQFDNYSGTSAACR